MCVDTSMTGTAFVFCYKVLSSPGRVCGGVPMPSNFCGARPHGAPQDTEMDVAWQELMAISELQVKKTQLS